MTEQADHRLIEIKAEVLDSQTSMVTNGDAATPTADYQYALGVISEDTGGSEWKMLIDISASEYEDIVSALGVVARLEPPFHAGLVERNYRDLQAVHQFVTITLSLGREFASPNRQQFSNSVATSVVNWLTAMRLFLDHEETELKRRFGKQSAEVDAFTAATAKPLTLRSPATVLQQSSGITCSTVESRCPALISRSCQGAIHEQSSRFCCWPDGMISWRNFPMVGGR